MAHSAVEKEFGIRLTKLTAVEAFNLPRPEDLVPDNQIPRADYREWSGRAEPKGSPLSSFLLSLSRRSRRSKKTGRDIEISAPIMTSATASASASPLLGRGYDVSPRRASTGDMASSQDDLAAAKPRVQQVEDDAIW
ncbi:hypothetical protein CDD83_6367 [Cordyceps sp. RAO-2017]|nr:hypothetical protein CDD83_6367 [Cordyceps sp. RAO-2017]